MVNQMTEKRRSPLAVRISPDLEARITQQASTAGEPVPDYVRRVLYEVTTTQRRAVPDYVRRVLHKVTATQRREVVEGTAAQ